jgi:hypothetical protein
MDASQARKLTETNRKIGLERFISAIRRAAEDGDAKVSVAISGKEAKFAESLMTQLRLMGYQVKRDSYSDFRESWDSLVIEW